MFEILVFNHLPRTGGLTLATILSTWLEPVYDYQSDASEVARHAWRSHPIDLKSLRKGQVLIGHYGGDTPIDMRYPDIFVNPRFRVLTVLRDPWSATQSALASKAAVHLLETASLGDTALALAGRMGRALGAPPLSAKEALSRYWFVGTTERLSDSVRLLAQRLGVGVPSNIPFMNRSTRSMPEEVDQAFERFRCAAQIDYELHAEANARLNSDIARHA